MSTPRNPGWKNLTHPVKEIPLEKIREFYRKKTSKNSKTKNDEMQNLQGKIRGQVFVFSKDL
jgi:hypothetical protein